MNDLLAAQRQFLAQQLPPYGQARISVDSQMGRLTLMRLRAQEYERLGIPVPKDLPADIARLEREIKTQWRAEQEERLRAAESEQEELRSREEKRQALGEEIARLRQELGL